jgi:hypothetical protein
MREQSDQARAGRFGRIVQERRVELGLTQAQMVSQGGPSAPTQRKIEDGDPTISAVTLHKLDAPLRWTPGSAARAFHGGDPEPKAGGEAAHSPMPGPDSIGLDAAELTALMALVGQLNDVAQMIRCSCADPAAVAELDAAIASYAAAVGGISARYATALLEHNGGPGRSLHPLVEIAFAHLFDVPAAGTAEEQTERLYRRWLAGRRVGVDAATEKQFRIRWADATAGIRRGPQ